MKLEAGPEMVRRPMRRRDDYDEDEDDHTDVARDIHDEYAY